MSFPSIATSRPPARRVSCGPREFPRRAGREQGFSLLEMAIVMAVLLTVGSIALLQVRNVVRSVHLQQAASNYANLLQQARVRAVQDDNYYSVVASTNSTVCGSSAAVTACALIDVNQTGLYNSGDPYLAFPVDVKPMPSSSAPAVSNLEGQFLPSPSTWNTVYTGAEGPTFGPRGLPCQPSALTGGTCPSLTPTSYMTFLKNVRSQNWEAITVSPAGRIRLWSYGGGSWSPMN